MGKYSFTAFVSGCVINHDMSSTKPMFPDLLLACVNVLNA